MSRDAAERKKRVGEDNSIFFTQPKECGGLRGRREADHLVEK